MAAPYIKSFLYLGAFGSVGYTLMIFTEPTAEKKLIIAHTGYKDPSSNEVKTQKALFLKKIQEATTDTPIYLRKSSLAQKKKAAEKEEEASKQPTKREIN